MSEKNPQTNISSFEKEKERKKQEQVLLDRQMIQRETQQEENVARGFLQNNPDMLLSFLRAQEGITERDTLSSETRIRLKEHLSTVVIRILSAKNYDDSIFKLEQELLADPAETEQEEFDTSLRTIDLVITMCLDFMKSKEHIAEVISLYGDENTQTQEEIFTHKILSTFNAIDEFYKDAEHSSVQTRETNSSAVFAELNRRATTYLDQLDRLRDSLGNGYGEILDTHREQWMKAEELLGRVLNFTKNNS